MNVKELKQILEKAEDTDEIIMAGDPEGYTHSPLWVVDMHMHYLPLTDWDGEVYQYINPDILHGKKTTKAIVLIPAS
jgi:hypothetical protein